MPIPSNLQTHQPSKFLCDFDSLERISKQQGHKATTVAEWLGWSPADLSRIKGKSMLSSAQVTMLAENLRCATGEFAWPLGSLQRNDVIDTVSIRGLYRRLVDEHQKDPEIIFTASIISGDGYLELNDQAFFDSICELLDNGIQFNYFYSKGEHEATQNEYESLYHKFQVRFSTADKGKLNVNGFKIVHEPSLFFGWKTRYILFAKRKNLGNSQIIGGYCYAQSAEKSNDADYEILRDVWFRMPLSEAIAYHKRLIQFSEPIKNLRCFEGSRVFDPSLQRSYRIMFSHRRKAEIYRRLATALNTENHIVTEVDRLFSLSPTTKPKPLEVLDIGFGNGDVTNGIKEKLVGMGYRQVQAVLLDPGAAPVDLRNPKIRGAHTVGEPFEEAELNSRSFDLIIASHSLYLTCPSYVDKIYDILKNNGHAIIVHAPITGNFINTISHELDAMRLSEQGLSSNALHRCYGEELWKYLTDRFGSQGVTRKVVSGDKCSIDRDLIIDSDNARLTEEGRSFFELFGCMDFSDSQLNTILEFTNKIHPKVKRLPNENWIFVIDKSKIRRDLNFQMHGLKNIA
jgi:ubiquinone/menaquinone biosynthesis C-methylase UbiE